MIPKYITNSMDILLFIPSHNHRHANTTFGKPDEHYKSVVFLLAFYMKRILTAEQGTVSPGGGGIHPAGQKDQWVHPS